MHQLTIETDPNLKGLPKEQINRLYRHIYKKENVPGSEVTIIFGGKQLLQKLKKEFFNIDQTTDVIAFRLNEYKETIIEGEIYICLPVAMENSKIYNEPYKREIARLIIHGALHLIGYKDDTKKMRSDMRKLEDKYLEEMGF